jgi:putative ABC transport system permease protein
VTGLLYRFIALWYRLTAAFRRRRIGREFEEELAFHVSMREAELIGSGLSSTDARRAALRRFGNRTRITEELWEMWTFPSIESVWQDVRYAIRMLWRTPTFTAVAALTLAIGMGGTTAIYSLGRAASIDSLPYDDPGRLVQLWGTVQRAQVERRGASYRDFLDWRAHTSVFEDIALFDGGSATLVEGSADRISIEAVSEPYFRLLGIHPSLGRTFSPSEDVAGRPELVAVLSDGLWRRSFGGDSAIVGRRVVLDGRPFVVIGVMPAGFQGLTDQAELWTPFTVRQSADTLANRGNRGFVGLARLKQGVSLERAQTEFNTISARLEREYPDTNEKRAVAVSPLEQELFGNIRGALSALMAAVVLVLVMACASVGNLLLARSEGRQREIAVRAAIGASGRRLLRQLLTESCVLTSLGALAGFAVAEVGVDVLLATTPVQLPSFVHPRIDQRTALFAAALAIGTGLLLGLAPAAHARIAQLADALRESARGSGGRHSARVRSGLVIAEIALAVALLVGAGLMIRTVQNLSDVDPGFDPSSVLTLRVSIPADATVVDGAGAGAASTADNRVLFERVRALPGVAAVSMASDLPLEGNASAVFYTAEGQGVVNAQNRPRAYIHRVTPDFFSTLGIPIVAGRTFEELEIVPDTPVVIVSERLTRRFWPGQDPIGKRMKLGDVTSNSPWRQIVGVVREVKYRGLPDNPTADPDIYFPVLPGQRNLGLAVRTSMPPAAVANALRAAVQEVDPRIPVYGLAELETLVRSQTAQSRFTMWLMTVFAAVALLLAALGVYGIMSYAVAQRTREIGIRLALGATARAVLRTILASGARLVGAGLVIGCLTAFLLKRRLESELFAVGSIDAAAIVAIALLATVALVACTIPAARATRLNPLDALRQE